MSKRQLAAGRIIGGDRDGQLWVGVQNDETAYDRLSGGLSGDVTHAIIIGDDDAAMALLRVIVETLLVEDSVDDLLSGVESMLKGKSRDVVARPPARLRRRDQRC